MQELASVQLHAEAARKSVDLADEDTVKLIDALLQQLADCTVSLSVFVKALRLDEPPGEP